MLIVRFAVASAHGEIVAYLCAIKVGSFVRKGDHLTAGRLCCFTANLMLVAFRRMEKQADITSVGRWAVDLYMNGIRALYQYRELPSEDFLRTAGGYFTSGSQEYLSFASAHFEFVAE